MPPPQREIKLAVGFYFQIVDNANQRQVHRDELRIRHGQRRLAGADHHAQIARPRPDDVAGHLQPAHRLQLPVQRLHDQQLDALVENWTRTLVENLDDPTARKSIDLLPGEQKSAVSGFLRAKKLPDKIGNDLVQGMQTALSGLIAISVTPDDLLGSLSGGGAPCTVEQLRTRFEEFLQRITRGREAARVRLVIDRGEPKGGEA